MLWFEACDQIQNVTEDQAIEIVFFLFYPHNNNNYNK